MSRIRPYSQLGNPEIVEQLFDAAFKRDAVRFEDLLYEIEGGEPPYYGRSNLSNIRLPLINAAKRVFESDK